MVQANADNKKRVKEALDNVVTTEIAYFDKALVEAFDLLREVSFREQILIKILICTQIKCTRVLILQIASTKKKNSFQND